MDTSQAAAPAMAPRTTEEAALALHQPELGRGEVPALLTDLITELGLATEATYQPAAVDESVAVSDRDADVLLGSRYYAGHLPLWLAPKQAVICTIVSDADDYAREAMKALIQQAIVLIDAAEHDEQDPAKLRRLLQVDSTVTRLRRKIENLRVLSGDRPGRRWRDPWPLGKLVPSAIGETEHYTRINVRAVPAVAVKGPAVTDTIRVLAELMDNATRFSPPNSPVVVRVERWPPRRNPEGSVVRVSAVRQDGHLSLAVEDQGCGIPPELQPHVFDLFVRGEPDFDFQRGRFGVGLTLARGIIEDLRPFFRAGKPVLVVICGRGRRDPRNQRDDDERRRTRRDGNPVHANRA